MADQDDSNAPLDKRPKTNAKVSRAQNMKDASDARATSVRGIMKRNRETNERQD